MPPTADMAVSKQKNRGRFSGAYQLLPMVREMTSTVALTCSW